MMTRAQEIALHQAEQAAGLRPPPVPRMGLKPGKRSRINSKCKMKATYEGRLDEYVAYLLERLAMARELQAERDYDG